ncbi:hypothetical protein B0T25DRAFT_570320 [Lasiosphaeria hispida]|uniref:Uncharacterized protein n=1 Tax=Lasiosphaeria hispida TaxID=260671 RepID=A0AAJ0HF59_9PEZI|nr:hypothetical protein B0T25DRAFT_570320 [Lasiosphaeria hispida]
MSFGLNDITTVARLLATLIDRIRTGPQEFRELATDLLLAQSCIRQIEAHQTVFQSRAARLTRLDRDTTAAVFGDIQAGLAELQRELDGHRSQNALGRALDHAVAERQRVLRDRLQFQFSKLGILYQSFSLAQGARMAEALREIRLARLYDEEEDAALTESITDFRRKYVERGDHRGGSSASAGANADAAAVDVEVAPSVMTGHSKDRLVRQWMGDVARFEKGTYFDGFSEVGVGDGATAGDPSPPPPPPSRGFLWHFMLWDIRRRKRTCSRQTALALGFIFPAVVTGASFAMSPFLIWAATMADQGVPLSYYLLMKVYNLNFMQIIANSIILITTLVAFYASVVYKHTSRTCNRLARLMSSLCFASYALVFTYGAMYWNRQRPHLASTVHLHNAVTISSLVYGFFGLVAMVASLAFSGIASSRWMGGRKEKNDQDNDEGKP